MMVRKEGLEPSRQKALEPKSRASTNSATFAKTLKNYHFSISCISCSIVISERKLFLALWVYRRKILNIFKRLIEKFFFFCALLQRICKRRGAFCLCELVNNIRKNAFHLSVSVIYKFEKQFFSRLFFFPLLVCSSPYFENNFFR